MTQAHANTTAHSATMAETPVAEHPWIVTVCSSLKFDFV
jgi:hypothetical protein